MNKSKERIFIDELRKEIKDARKLRDVSFEIAQSLSHKDIIWIIESLIDQLEDEQDFERLLAYIKFNME